MQEECAGAQVVVFAGSLPPGADPGLYARLVDLVDGWGCRAVVDTVGTELRLAAQKRLYAIKPNYREAVELLDLSHDAAPSHSTILRGLSQLNVEHLILTLGEQGAYIRTENRIVHVTPPQVPVGNTAGAGDSVLAVYLAGLTLRWPLEERAAKAVAAGSAAVQGISTDLCTPEAVQQLLPRVVVHDAAP